METFDVTDYAIPVHSVMLLALKSEHRMNPKTNLVKWQRERNQLHTGKGFKAASRQSCVYTI